jgi:rhamnosyltransferase
MANRHASASVVAVVVTYHPDKAVLALLLDALTPQVSATVVVDNGSTDELGDWLAGKGWAGLRYVAQGKNLGVATAQNRGIGEARALAADHVLLFDQDSIPGDDLVSRLLTALAAMAARDCRVAAVGPRYVDVRNPTRRCFPRVTGWRFEMRDCDPGREVVEADALISSGTLIPLAVLDVVGPLEDALFIDQVDIEWGLRARSLGYRSFGVCAALLHHSLGEAPIRFLGRHIMHHGWLRHYYIFRNAVRLIRRPYVPVGWRLMFLRMMVLRIGFYGCLVAPRVRYLKAMLLGIGHGLLGRGGPFGS